MQGLSSKERDALASDSGIEEIAAQTTPNTGYAKIKYTCHRAIREGIEYVWVDTCCIDKTSSAELSEAINSMMRWYENSEICYVYLADVPSGVNLETKDSAFAKSRWFTRGWTLQELLAPRRLAFLASDWSYISSLEKVSILIGNITGIPLSLLGPRRSKFSITRRMSWASRRITSRREDTAYCLIGIFGVNMPLLYGEGNEAFLRLQEEIIKHSDDLSIFAWNDDFSNKSFNSFLHGDFSDKSVNSSLHSPPRTKYFDFTDRYSTIGFLASFPCDFADGGDFVSFSVSESNPSFSITNKGLSMKVPLFRGEWNVGFVLLECQTSRDLTQLLAVPVRCIKENIYARLGAPIHVTELILGWNGPRHSCTCSLPTLSGRLGVPIFGIFMSFITFNPVFALPDSSLPTCTTKATPDQQ